MGGGTSTQHRVKEKLLKVGDAQTVLEADEVASRSVEG